jgi:hypothetical protein
MFLEKRGEGIVGHGGQAKKKGKNMGSGYEFCKLGVTGL